VGEVTTNIGLFNFFALLAAGACVGIILLMRKEEVRGTLILSHFAIFFLVCGVVVLRILP
jgi:hypothetical protein